MDVNDFIIYNKVIPQRKADYVAFPQKLVKELSDYLIESGINSLYSHQAEMFESVMGGKSRFINIIPQQLLMRDTVEASKLTLNDLRKEVALSKQTAKEIDNAATDIVTVKHEKYGIGSIIKEDDNMVEVKFEKYGVKEFIKAFCELEYLSQGRDGCTTR